MDACRAASPQFRESAFAEYHLYTLQGKTDVRDNETKQLSLFNADRVPAKKVFVFDPSAPNPWGGYNSDNSHKVQVKIEVDNSQKHGLGIPMPAGKVRVYKKDADGALQFIGEDQIDHTPKDEKIRLYIGDAFDLVGQRKLMRTENVSSNVQRQFFETSLRNHKNIAVVIALIEHPYGDWHVINASSDYQRKDANTLEFPVNVLANAEVKISYAIENKW